MNVTLNMPKKYRSVCTNDQLLGWVILPLQRLDVFRLMLTKKIGHFRCLQMLRSIKKLGINARVGECEGREVAPYLLALVSSV